MSLDARNYSERSADELSKMRRNALCSKREGKNIIHATEALTQIDDELIFRFAKRMCDGWTTGFQGLPRYFMKDGAMRAIVVRLEPHGAKKGGYLITVNGRDLDDQPRHIDEARRLAEREFGI